MEHRWRHILLLLIAAGSLAGLMSLPPIVQHPAYHVFADQRAFFDVPRFLDIVTNLPFLIVGIAGLRRCLRGRTTGALRSWVVFFAGVAMIGLGSAYYHLDPTDQTLAWDRMPMTVGFMGALVAVLAERVSKRIEEHALLPMVLAGMASVLWWVVFGDLRPYCWIQLLPMMLIPAVLLLYARRRSEDRFIILAVVFYAFAKGTEYFDQEVYRMTCRLLSGHSLKHLVAAAGCAILFAMLKRRKRAGPGRGPATGEQEAGNWQNGLLQARKDAP